MRLSRLVAARKQAVVRTSNPDASRPVKRFGAGGRFFRYRNALGIGLAVLLLAFPWGRIEPAAWCAALGLSLVLAGAALRLWAILQIGGAARKTSSLKAVRLVSWGPFAMTRNPIYIANIAVFAGFAVLSRLLWAVPLVVLALGAWYHRLIPREERFLEETFGEEYREYAATTNRWLPSPRFRRRPAGVPAYPLTRALRRERGLLAIVALGIASFLVVPMLSDRVVHRLKNPSITEKEAAPEKDQEKRGEQPLDVDDE
jgi:protein-S-isoprenylcysteine O-methyltransferase Ste14